MSTTTIQMGGGNALYFLGNETRVVDHFRKLVHLSCQCGTYISWQLAFLAVETMVFLHTGANI